MSEFACSLLSLADDEDERTWSMDDYAGPVARWCPGCGDHAILTAVEKLLAAEQLAPERTMFVSGIGCSSRFPHYLSTYGFHGLHGRALPVATGIRLHRPDLTVFVVMGDGDCTSIGAGHWVHTTRYNPNMVALLLDNAVYGLTKNQTSPTSPKGWKSNTQPAGNPLPPLNPLSIALGITNASFVAQTGDWLPGHLFWAYFTGCAFIAAGIAVLTNLYARLAVTLSVLQVALFLVLVWLPIVATGSKDPFQWSETILNVALLAGGWVIADSYCGTRWFVINGLSTAAAVQTSAGEPIA